MGFVSSSLLRQHLLTCWFLVYLCAGTSGQTSVGVTPSTGQALPTVSPQVTPKTQDINTTVLQLETALSEEAKEHREFLRDSLDEMKWFVAIMAGLAIAILTLLNLKSAKDIRTQVNARFKADVDALVTDKVAQFETFVEQNKKKIEETSTQLNELSASFGDLVEGLTLSFAALDKHRIGAEWDASRRDAIRKLEALRNKFPVMRTVGILVGRLHASFDDHEVAIKALAEVQEERDRRRMAPDSDYAALLYNKACYRNRLAEKAEKQNDFSAAQKFRTDAWNDLSCSVQFDPTNKSQAISDPDLETLLKHRDPATLGENKIPKLTRRSLRALLLTWQKKSRID
jgi:hypothetical protein